MLGEEGQPTILRRLRLMAEDAFNCSWLEYQLIDQSDVEEMWLKLDVEREIAEQIEADKAGGAKEARKDGLGNGVMPKAQRTNNVGGKPNMAAPEHQRVHVEASSPSVPEPVTVANWGTANPGSGVMKRT